MKSWLTTILLEVYVKLLNTQSQESLRLLFSKLAIDRNYTFAPPKNDIVVMTMGDVVGV